MILILKSLKNPHRGKTRITIMLDNDVLGKFRLQAEKEGSGYQTLINKALKSSIGKESLSEERLRKVIREELSNQKRA